MVVPLCKLLKALTGILRPQQTSYCQAAVRVSVAKEDAFTALEPGTSKSASVGEQ